jgi:hypothetical protein
MQRPLIPFGVWIAGLTVMGGAAWFVLFGIAFVEGGPCFFSTAAVAVVVAPCLLVYKAARSWPHQSLPFCLAYSAAPFIAGFVGLVAFSVDEWPGTLLWSGAAVVTFGMTLLGALLGRKASQSLEAVRRDSSPR